VAEEAVEDSIKQAKVLSEKSETVSEQTKTRDDS
jgi:hypothetical protein